MKKQFLLSFLIAVFAVVTGFSQVTTSKIEGLVVDENSEGLFGANVAVVHEPTGTVSGAMTLESGRFFIPNLRVGGPYKVTISYVGYSTIEYTDVYLDLGKAFDLKVQLIAESEQLDEIVITGGVNSTFNNSRTGSETSVGKRELTKLPSISRSASDFTRLDPSASGGSFGGRNDQYNNFTLDGSIFNNPFGLDAATPGGQTDSQPISLDAIEQISVSTAPYDVTQSGFTGAAVNAVTKSGTNKISGTVYGFFRNQDLTGSKIKGEKIFVPKLEQYQYGFSIGAPIIKNKLFVFANFEKEDRTDLGQSWLPKESGGINASRVSEQDLLMVQSGLAGIGYDTGTYEGFTHDGGSTKGIIKLDWNINDKNRLSFVYNFLDASKDKPAHPTAINRRGPDFNTLQFENSGYTINNKIQSFLVELNSTFADNITNKFQAGYTSFDDSRDPFSSPAPVINITKDGSPYIIAGHEPFSINNKLDQKVFQISDNLNITKGDHNFTVGFSFEKFMFKNSFNLKGYGFDVFGSVDINDFDASTYQQTLLDAQATFASKNALEDGVDGGWNLAETNVGQFAFYGQDEWNVSEDFKLTYGIRFDKPLFFNTSEMAQKFIDTENSEWFVPGIEYIDPDTGEEFIFDSTEMPSNKVLFSPRVGFNWDVKSDKTLQVRGGTGIFTGRLPFVWIGNQVGGSDVFFYQVVDPDFKFPQVWRTSLGADHEFKNGVILTADLSYTKDINSVHVQNWGLDKPTGTLQGVDGRPIYTATDHQYWDAPWGAEPANAYVLTNSNKGNAFNASIKGQKSFVNGLYTMLAYNYMNSKDVNSIEAEITGDAFAFNPAYGNVNSDVSAHSKYGDQHRVIGVISKGWKYGANDKWGTTISSFFEYAQGGRFSYTYGGDINGDGSSVNDLIYIPTELEIAQMTFTGGASQALAFNNYIKQDDYLSDKRGEYADRYGAISPWRGRWDVKVLQDLKIGKNNQIQFSIDMLNLGNFISSDWGLVQQPNAVQPIGVSVVDGNPIYSFDEQIQETFGYDASLASRWQVQFGLRYSF